MRRILFLILCLFIFFGSAYAQRMSDEQVVEYVKQAQAAGKSQKQMTAELLRRGVTREQVLRIKDKYENSGVAVPGSEAPSQMRKRSVAVGESYEAAELDDQKAVVDERLESQSAPEAAGIQIFGHNLFQNRNLSFEPSVNLATPANYRLGPGDEVIIDIWGASENTIRQTISPEGSIQVKDLGPVYLNGMTVKEANAYLQRELSKIYSGIGGGDPNSQIRLTLGDIRTIQIHIMGEVTVPGTYTLSAFSTVFHALYRAGGVNNIGSLRDIRLVRNGETIEHLDVYEFIMQGKMNDDVRLQEGDVIIVSPYQSLVEIVGKVKRPMYYEMKPTETIGTLLRYAGGFTGDAYKKAIRLVRKSGREHQIFNVDEMDYSVFRLEDGDMLTVDSVLNRFENRVEIRGAVYREGLYQLSGEVNTVKQLIKKAEGVRGDAFLNRAVINREHEDLTREVISIDLKGLLKGVVADIPLQKNDILYIPSIQDLKEEPTVTIHGEVADPGTYLYADKMTIEDLVLESGGLLEAASTTKIDVSRRIKSPKSTDDSNIVGQTFTFDLKDGLLIGAGSENFYLEPFDEVYVRKSPAYRKQKNVGIIGEALFTGTYALSKKNERLSDLVAKAGGVTSDAYVRGARLIRKMSEEELRRKEDATRMAIKVGADSTTLYVYTVGIHLDEALKNPGSDYDMVLREGDVLFIPEYVSTVKINGAVMYPNTVLYKEGENSRYYINQAGGYASNAKKRSAFVVYMNGTVSRIRSGSKTAIEPGCEIIIPTKDPSKRMSVAEMVGMGTSIATLGTMIATLVNLFK